MKLDKVVDLVVIGGGAAGFMGAIKAAEEGVISVVILEATKRTLEKVRISGGGRCNVTNACWEPTELSQNYPRGKSSLIGAFNQFATGDAVAWFEERGLPLIIEPDGRIFPKSNSSKEVIRCLLNTANRAGVSYSTKMIVKTIKFMGEKGFFLQCSDGTSFNAKKILLATGGDPRGKKLAYCLGHQVIPAAPSIFSFNLTDFYHRTCAGITVDNAYLSLKCGSKLFKEYGRILITHKGLSGPAILRLSAFAARELHETRYKALLEVNWTSATNDSIKDSLKLYRENYSSRTLIQKYPFEGIPKRLWISFLSYLGISPQTRWGGFSKSQEIGLCDLLSKNVFSINSRGPYGEEFVTAGGVCLNEVNFKSMESRIQKGLYFAGEVLDIDGVTGGFNFQHCWTSAWIAGKAIAKDLALGTGRN